MVQKFCYILFSSDFFNVNVFFDLRFLFFVTLFIDYCTQRKIVLISKRILVFKLISRKLCCQFVCFRSRGRYRFTFLDCLGYYFHFVLESGQCFFASFSRMIDSESRFYLFIKLYLETDCFVIRCFLQHFALQLFYIFGEEII